MMSDRSEAKLIPFFKMFLGITVLMVLFLAMFRDFDHDELEAIHSAWKVLNGEMIYIDFFQHHHPFFYYLISPVIWAIGENTVTLIVLRLFMYGAFIGMLWCTFRITNLVFDNSTISWLATLFLASMAMFSQKAIEIRPDVPQVLFALVSILLLFRHIRYSNKYQFYLSAACLGLSFLFLQKTIFIIAGIGLVQLYWVYEKKLTTLQLVMYWLGFGVFICPYYLYLLFTHQLETYIFWNWILNMHFEGSFSAFNAIIDSFYYNHFIWIFFVVGLIICFRKRILDIPILSLILLGTVFLVKAPYRQYFMPFLPLMCGVAACGVLKSLNDKQLKAVVVLSFLVPMILFIRTVIVYPNQPQMDKINWVLERTNPSDFVYDGDIYFNLYRKDIDFFWYSTEPKKGGLGTYKKLKPYDYDIKASIEKYKPKVISNLFVDNILDSTVLIQYRQSEAYPDLYIKSK